jgi:hypothetical protein
VLETAIKRGTSVRCQSHLLDTAHRLSPSSCAGSAVDVWVLGSLTPKVLHLLMSSPAFMPWMNQR